MWGRSVSLTGGKYRGGGGPLGWAADRGDGCGERDDLGDEGFGERMVACLGAAGKPVLGDVWQCLTVYRWVGAISFSTGSRCDRTGWVGPGLPTRRRM